MTINQFHLSHNSLFNHKGKMYPLPKYSLFVIVFMLDLRITNSHHENTHTE